MSMKLNMFFGALHVDAGFVFAFGASSITRNFIMRNEGFTLALAGLSKGHVAYPGSKIFV